MTRLNLWLGLSLLCLSAPQALAKDDEPSAKVTSKEPGSVESALEDVQSALEKEDKLSTETKTSLQNLLRLLAKERADTKNKTTTQPGEAQPAATGKEKRDETLPDWQKYLERFSFYGDFRLRAESNFQRDDQKDRQRARIRLRLGFTVDLGAGLSAGLRLSSGDPDDPNSPHQTFDSSFARFPISIDRAFATYKPDFLPGAFITVGKFAHPYLRSPVYGEIVWDNDIQPEGGSVGYRYQGEGTLRQFQVFLGEYFLSEVSDNHALLTSGGLGVVLSLVDNLTLQSAVSYYHYADLTPNGDLDVVNVNRGNQVVDRDGDGSPDRYLSQFGIVETYIGLSYRGLKGCPITVVAEYIQNIRARSNKNGWAAGFELGQNKETWDLMLRYSYQVIEQEAVFSSFTGDDGPLQTNYRRHYIAFFFRIHPQAHFRARAQAMAPERRIRSDSNRDSDRSQWRLQLDLDIRF